MARIITEIERFFKTRSILSILIAINIAVYIGILLTSLVIILFKGTPTFVKDYLAVHANLETLLYTPWTLITYMFTHTGFFHILFNLLWLYWFGKLFDYFFGSRPMGSLYFLGGIAGAALYIAAFNIFPYFDEAVKNSVMIGASASVMAIVFAVAVYRPDYSIGLLFLGRIRLIWIALALLLINLITVQTTANNGDPILSNAGGFFAHIGGILVGVWFAQSYKKGKDITKGLNSFFDGVANLFKKSDKPKKSKMKVKYKKPETDMEYNTRKKKENDEIDSILDKIKRSGYDALTESEKNKLFNAGKK